MELKYYAVNIISFYNCISQNCTPIMHKYQFQQNSLNWVEFKSFFFIKAAKISDGRLSEEKQ